MSAVPRDGQTFTVAHLTTVDLSLWFLLLAQLRGVRDAGGTAIGISAPGPWVEPLEREGIRHIPLASSTRSANVLADGRAASELWQILRRERIDVLHTHNPKPGVYGRMVGRAARVPIVAFYIALDDPWLLPSWDQFMLAQPFSRGLLRISRPLWVPKQADGEALTAFHSELQQMLDRTRISAEEMLARGEHRRLPLHHWTR